MEDCAFPLISNMMWKHAVRDTSFINLMMLKSSLDGFKINFFDCYKHFGIWTSPFHLTHLNDILVKVKSKTVFFFQLQQIFIYTTC